MNLLLTSRDAGAFPALRRHDLDELLELRHPVARRRRRHRRRRPTDDDRLAAAVLLHHHRLLMRLEPFVLNDLPPERPPPE